MAQTIKKLTIEGFKSIRKLEDFELRPLNVLIGANGAGKSNFVGFFRLLRELIEGRLQFAVATMEGGADACLHLGPKVTNSFSAEIYFGLNGYEFSLASTPDNKFVFESELTYFRGDYQTDNWRALGSGHTEALLKESSENPPAAYVYRSIASWVVYHFHDTSITAQVRREQKLNDHESFRANAENLASFLYYLKREGPGSYRRIRDAVRLAAPFFDDFKFRVEPDRNAIQLEWLQTESDSPMRATQLSDGTLRFICMATALLQPLPPPTMLFDEPELGLHPYALTLLAELFQHASKSRDKQIIISTQSVQLLNGFDPEAIIVVERDRGASTFRRLNTESLAEWLEDYSLGELWQKNLLGGRPQEERIGEPVP